MARNPRFLVSTFEGSAVVRSCYRDAKAEARRLEALGLTYCASIKRYRGALATGSVLEDGRFTGYRCQRSEVDFAVEGGE